MVKLAWFVLVSIAFMHAYVCSRDIPDPTMPQGMGIIQLPSVGQMSISPPGQLSSQTIAVKSVKSKLGKGFE